MGVIFSRMIVVYNDTPWEISLREKLHSLELDHYIHFPPGRSEFPASHFLKRNHAFGLPSRIAIEVRGREVDSFIPQNFLDYVRITFSHAGAGNLVVRIVRARLLDLCRLRGFGCLGRTYHGRPDDIIMEYAIDN
nr:uncharacterized protein LOC102605550 [Ipomoea trifida]